MSNERIRGSALSAGGERWDYEASWYLAGEMAIWDAVLRRHGQVRGMLGGKVLLDPALTQLDVRVEAFIRDALAHDIAARE